MARKFGKKKAVIVDLLSYNIGLAGLSGIGKTTLIKNVCETLVGDEGYLMLDIGKESGHDCIDGIVSETIEDWDKLDKVLDDIIENRTTDYKDLKVVVFDTLDELFVLGEEEIIKVWNRRN
jgi:GTPase SAR1 family protein